MVSVNPLAAEVVRLAKELQDARSAVNDAYEELGEEQESRDIVEHKLKEVGQLILDAIAITHRDGPAAGMQRIHDGLDLIDEVLPRIQTQELPHDWLSRWKVLPLNPDGSMTIDTVPPKNGDGSLKNHKRLYVR